MNSVTLLSKIRVESEFRSYRMGIRAIYSFLFTETGGNHETIKNVMIQCGYSKTEIATEKSKFLFYHKSKNNKKLNPQS